MTPDLTKIDEIIASAGKSADKILPILQAMTALAQNGIASLIAAQKKALGL